MVSRRTFVLGGLAGLGVVGGAGGAGAVLVEHDVLPGKVRLDKALGRCGGRPTAPTTPGVVQRRTVRSTARGSEIPVTVVLPAGTTSLRGLPVAVALHGSGGGGASLVSGLALDHYLTDAVARRTAAPFAIIAADGGPDGYWHPHRGGDDPLGMITDELLPWLHREGARTAKVGAMGWSMGGYGALLLAETIGVRRTAAVVAASPAVFASYGDARNANQRAFDDAGEFDSYDVMRGLGRLNGLPVWVDCGNSDPFAPMVRRLRDRLRSGGGLGGAMSEGCHDVAFWRRRLPAQISFMGLHLTGGS